jgi:outer membrane protein assembly factor BamB
MQCNALSYRLVGCALLGGLVFALAGTAQADWPEFRGPAQNGVVANGAKLPVEWQVQDNQRKNVRWHTPTEGLGWSSPVVVGNSIYVTSARQGTAGSDAKPLAESLTGPQSLYLSCYNASNGLLIFDQKIFDQPTDAPNIHKKNSHASPTVLAYKDPTTNATQLFVHFGHQGTACLALDGKILWTDREHSYNPVHGNGGSPIVVGDLLILTCDGSEKPYTLALDVRTGKEVWRTQRDIATDRTFSFATPLAITVDGQVQVISPGSDIVQSLDPKTGRVLWSVRYSGFSLIVRPVYHQGLVLISTGYMSPKLLGIDPRGTGDVTDTHVRWSVPTAVPNTPSPVPVGDQLVMVSDGGVATGISVADGTKVWQKRLGGNYSASLIAIGNRVYFQSEAGEAIVMEIGQTPTEIGRCSLPGRVFASYAVDQDDLIIRTEDGLYRIGEDQ